MTEKTNKDKSRDSELKVFQYIEDTVAGTVSFVESFLWTAYVLVAVPHRFLEHRSDRGGRRSLVSPYTFLALSLFALTSALIIFVRINPNHFYALADTSARPETVLPPLSLPRIFIYAIPQILMLSWCSRLLAPFLCSDKELRDDYVDVRFYACALQALIMVLYVVFGILSLTLKFRVPLLFTVLQIYLLVAPAILLSSSHIRLERRDLNARSWFRSTLRPLLFSVVTASIMLICGATCAAIDILPAYRSHKAKETQIVKIVQHVIGRISIAGDTGL